MRTIRLGLVSLALVPLLAATASAGSITIYDTFLNPWTVSWNDPRVLSVTDTTVGQDAQNPIRTTDLEKEVNFTTNDPVVLLFTQNAVGTQTSTGAAGLNFVMLNTIFNNTGWEWSGFTETIEDHDLFNDDGELIVADPPPTGSGFHPPAAHFHTPLTFGSNPGGFSLLDPDATQSGQIAELGGGLMPDSGALLEFSLRVHDHVAVDYLRSFTLTETPVPAPEPASVALVGAGLAALAVRRFRTWSRRRPRSASPSATCPSLPSR